MKTSKTKKDTAYINSRTTTKPSKKDESDIRKDITQTPSILKEH